MKPILRGVAFTAAILSLALGSGCRGQKANATEIPTVSNPAPVTVAAPAPPPPAAPAVVVVPAAPAMTSAAVPPGSIIITNATPAPALATAALGAAAPVPADTNVVLEAAPPPELNLSPGLAEVVKLVQAGVSEDVLMAYVTNSADYFNMGSGEILYLRDLGVTDNLITKLIAQDATPQALAAKKAATAVQPLPPGVALNTPATNIYPPTTAQVPAPALEATNTATGTLPPAVVYTVPAATQPVTVNYFYNELSPYGTWIDVPGHGRCWRPTIAVWNRSWRPYADGGRWLWTDSGWYWYSDYSWGWAPFHYGRWTSHGHYGWVWVPDVHWGPAWVSWRSSSSYCGWAPLPPSARWGGHGFYHNSLSVGVGFDFGLADFHYVYLPFNRFCDRRPSHYYVTSHRAREIHRETTVVNNYVTVNNAVVNRGVGYDRVAAVNRDTFRRVSLRPTSDTPRGSTRREVLESDGRTLTVTRPVNAGFVSGNTAAPRSTPNAPSVRPPTGGRSGTGTLGSNPRETTPSTPAAPRVDAPRGPRPAPTVTRSATRLPSDSAPVTSTPSMVTTPSTGGGRTVPAAPTTPNAEAPRGGRNAARPNTSQTQARVAPEVRTVIPAPAAPVVRVPPSTSAPRAETPSRVYVQPQPSRSEAPRISSPNPSFNSAPRAPSYSAPTPTPAPAPRIVTPRSPSPAPSVERSVSAPSGPRPAPSQAPARSGGDGGSRPGRSSGDDNGRRNSR